MKVRLFEHDFPEARVVRLEQNYRSTQVILDAATAVIQQNRNRKDKRLWTDRKGGRKIVYFRGGDELEEADFITRSVKQARAEDVDGMIAVLYRTNAQSRAIEDSLMREAVPYKIIGGVRFYERKEIKDALAYLKLIINPHDDVSLRRVINVPARGIGKGVMDSLQAIDPGGDSRRRAAAAGRGAGGDFDRAIAVGEAGVRRRRGEAGKSRDHVVANVPRSHRRARGGGANRVGLHLDRQDAGSHRLPERPPRREFRGSERADRKPDGARVGGARVRDPRAGRLTRRLCRPAVAAVGGRRRVRDARSQGLADDAPRGQGTRVSGRDHGGSGRGPVSRTRDRERAKRSSRRSAGFAMSG